MIVGLVKHQSNHKRKRLRYCDCCI